MRARKVKGLDLDAPLADNAERIIRARLDELYSFLPAALDPGEVETQHDMRIAAKRLRYLLELTGFCFEPYARQAVKRVRDLQDLLGEIHDCDVMLPLVLAQLERRREDDAAAVRALAGRAQDLDPGLASQAPGRDEYRGLETLVIYLRARRELLFGRFVNEISKLERGDFRARLERALDGRAAPRATASRS